jgi:RNA polymerase sigma-70 factor, ECF subfamily
LRRAGVAAVTRRPQARIARCEARVQAVLGQVDPMIKPAERLEAPAPQSAADEAMERYADGDDEAFSLVYDALAPRLYRYASWRTGSPAAAEDVVQQTFLQIHGARDGFVHGAAVLPWAYAIARRLLIDASRRSGREELRGPEALERVECRGTAPADEALIFREEQVAARRAFDRLPLALREPFVLVKLEGLSVKEAAEVLGITPGMVKVRAYRAKQALEEDLARRAGRTESAAPDPEDPTPDSVTT